MLETKLEFMSEHGSEMCKTLFIDQSLWMGLPQYTYCNWETDRTLAQIREELESKPDLTILAHSSPTPAQRGPGEPGGSFQWLVSAVLQGRKTLLFLTVTNRKRPEDPRLMQLQAASELGSGIDVPTGLMHHWFPLTDPPPEIPEGQIEIVFRYFGRYNAGTTVARTIEAPLWADIQSNYVGGTREHLSKLASRQIDASQGRLILWRGDPGTGKSYAIRALAQEIKGWCDVEYVVDPDVLLGGKSDYLIDTLLSGGDSERWKLLVMEDAGELISANERSEQGQAVSRLLNTVEGVLGQGLNLFVLITTNVEQTDELNPAIVRPGRCLANVQFLPFDRKSADKWLRARGVDKGDTLSEGTYTLAHLYGILAASKGESE